ncbi:MAG: helix-turn-helix transcriptional regulator [Halioglobus sp.]|nr:helix-turn-helix transcriptional regulator [Halioglobus sp.]MCP5191444.1 helix-turn-helix transcriptional regulator [Pseudomonadales bacterium]
MQLLSRTQRTLYRMFGHPEFQYRVPSGPPLILERYRAVIDTASIPPFDEPLLLIHTAGKQLSYRPAAHSTQLSSPGLVSLLPAGVPLEFAIGGVGEGMLLHFGGQRRVPAWVTARAEGLPTTFMDNVIVAIGQQIASAAGQPHANDDYLAILGNALLAQLRHTLSHPAPAEILRGSRSATLLTHVAVQYVQQHLDQPLSVARLAAVAGVGVTHFSNTFKRVTGVTPHRYILRERMARARELLRMTALTVGEVAEAVGFAGQSHFTQAFIREMDITPSAYRRMGRVNSNTGVRRSH